MDLYPSLIEICGLTPRDGLSGRSLVPLLRNPSLQTGRVVITSFGEGNYALTGSRWRYIRYRDGSEELYDSKNDPHEWNNLAPEPAYREVLNELFRTYQEIKPKNL